MGGSVQFSVSKTIQALLFTSCFLPPPAMGGDASVVRRSLSRQREERCHHGQPVGHGDPEGDRHQQPPAPAQTPPGHPGNGLPHQSVCAREHSLRKAQWKAQWTHSCKHPAFARLKMFVYCHYSQPVIFGWHTLRWSLSLLPPSQ